jgi:hypothetical protein
MSVARVVNRIEHDPHRGWSSHREWFAAVAENSRAKQLSDLTDPRLRWSAVIEGNNRIQQNGGGATFVMPLAWHPRSLQAAAGSDEQGEYALQWGGGLRGTHYGTASYSVGFGGDPTAARTFAFRMPTPSVKLAVYADKNHSNSGSVGGFKFTRKPETVNATATRTEFEGVNLEATTLLGLTYATEEIAEDVSTFTQVIGSAYETQHAAHMLNEKIRGLGGSEYLGILSAGNGARITVSKENGQLAGTIVNANVAKMVARSFGYDGAIWLANPNTFPQLATLSVGLANGGLLSYTPLEGASMTLAGRPLFFTEFCESLGTEGDLILANWYGYIDGVYSPLQTAESIHVRFVNHERTFKVWTRNAGQPWWRAALTPFKGSDTLSPFVTLAARA